MISHPLTTKTNWKFSDKELLSSIENSKKMALLGSLWTAFSICPFSYPSNKVFSCPNKPCFVIVKSSQGKHPLPCPSAVSTMKLYYQEATFFLCRGCCITISSWYCWYCYFLTNYLFHMESLLLPGLLLLEKFGYDPRHSTSCPHGPPAARTFSILNSNFSWRKSLYWHSQLFPIKSLSWD